MNRYEDRVSDIRIDTNEGRFILVMDGQVFDIHDVALELESEVRREIRPYALEAEHARQAVARGETLDEYLGRDTDEGYEPTDPKHPMYHALVSELTDSSTIDRARRNAQKRRPW